MTKTMQCLHRQRKGECAHGRGSGPGSLSGLPGSPTTPLADKAQSLITGLWDRPTVAEYWVSGRSCCQSCACVRVEGGGLSGVGL